MHILQGQLHKARLSRLLSQLATNPLMFHHLPTVHCPQHGAHAPHSLPSASPAPSLPSTPLVPALRIPAPLVPLGLQPSSPLQGGPPPSFAECIPGPLLGLNGKAPSIGGFAARAPGLPWLPIDPIELRQCNPLMRLEVLHPSPVLWACPSYGSAWKDMPVTYPSQDRTGPRIHFRARARRPWPLTTVLSVAVPFQASKTADP